MKTLLILLAIFFGLSALYYLTGIIMWIKYYFKNGGNVND